MKVSELIGAELDCWVAKAEGAPFVMRYGFACKEEEFDPDIHCHESSLKEWKCWTRYNYSSDWRNAGPIIERKGIEWERQSSADGMSNGWLASIEPTTSNRMPPWEWGETQLIAAMRAFVASKYGHEVSEE